MERSLKILIVVFLFPAFVIRSQTAYKKFLDSVDTYWYVSQTMFAVKSANQASSINVTDGKYKAEGDTLISGKTYKKFYRVDCPPLFPYGTSYEGAIREDTLLKRVFFLDNSATSEKLLYDFSLSVGDSAYFDFAPPASSFPPGYYKLITKDSFLSVGNTFTRFKLLKKTSGTLYSDTLTYLEGIGSIHHPLYLYHPGYFLNNAAYSVSLSPMLCLFNQAPSCFNLTCKLNNINLEFKSCINYLPQNWGSLIWFTASADSCQKQFVYGSGLSENKLNNNYLVYYNQGAKSILFKKINPDFSNNGVIEILDVAGKLVKSHVVNSPELIIPTDNLSTGYYILNFRGENGVLRKPLIISN